MTTLLLVRHGESMGNVRDLFCGQTDLPLSEKGKSQAACAAEKLKDEPLTALYASTLKRAAETAEIIGRYHDLTVQTDPGLCEIYGGEWEGIPYGELITRYPEEYAVWQNDIGFSRPIGGESVSEVRDRMIKTVEKIAKENEGGLVCIASHALALRMLACAVWNVPPEEIKRVPYMANAAITKMSWDGEQLHIVEYDHTSHLGALKTVLPATV